jgi:NADH-quinone oxidoreductase subunit E
MKKIVKNITYFTGGTKMSAKTQVKERSHLSSVVTSKVVPETTGVDTAAIDAIISKYKGREGEVLSILEETQKATKHTYLSEPALNYIAYKTGIPLSRIFNIATFYAFFNLKPQGDHTVTVCRGTACHTRGSKALLDDVGIKMGGTKALEEGDASFTTPDNKFTIRTVACFGQCALAPVVMIDETIYSSVTVPQLAKLIDAVDSGNGRKK